MNTVTELSKEEKDQATLGSFMRIILWHTKAVEHQINWNKALLGFKQKDKEIFNNSLKKMKSAISDIINIIPDPGIAFMVRKELENTEELGNFMALCNYCIELRPEDHEHVVDLIQAYLENKYYPKEKAA